MTNDWPRIRNLPESERAEFEKYLEGQTRPWIDGLPANEQDGYYEHDYDRWKRKLLKYDNE